MTDLVTLTIRAALGGLAGTLTVLAWAAYRRPPDAWREGLRRPRVMPLWPVPPPWDVPAVAWWRAEEWARTHVGPLYRPWWPLALLALAAWLGVAVAWGLAR